MTCKDFKKPVLTPKQMADFLMNHYSRGVSEQIKNDYRKRSLALLEEIHEPGYAIEVRKLMEEIYKGARPSVSSQQ